MKDYLVIGYRKYEQTEIGNCSECDLKAICEKYGDNKLCSWFYGGYHKIFKQVESTFLDFKDADLVFHGTKYVVEDAKKLCDDCFFNTMCTEQKIPNLCQVMCLPPNVTIKKK